MPTYSTTAITLQARKYKGTGRVVSFYTHERGKVEAVAEGIGRPMSKLAAAVEPFTVSRLLLSEGKQLDRLSQAEVGESHLRLRTDILRLAHASYVTELVARTTEPYHPEPPLFELLSDSLDALCQDDDPEMVMWSFTLGFLDRQGLAPDFATCCRCGAVAGLEVTYMPGDAGVACAACTPQGRGMDICPEARAVADSLRRMGPARAGRLTLGDAARAQLRRVLDTHVEHQYGFEPRSRRFLAQVRG